MLVFHCSLIIPILYRFWDIQHRMAYPWNLG